MLATLAHCALAVLAQAAGDHFDRVGGTDLGAEWSEQEGDLLIAGEELAPAQGFALAVRQDQLHFAASQQSVRFAQRQSSVGYVALVSGFANTDECIFLKLQDDDADGEFETVYFYRGNNSGLAWNAQEFRQSLVLPRSEGILSLKFEQAADVAVATVQDVHGGATETFRCSGLRPLANQLGRGVGCGGRGSVALDDWQLNGGQGAALHLSRVRGGAGSWTEVQVEGASPLQSVGLLVGSRLGVHRLATGLPCGGALLSIDRPSQVILVSADSQGMALYGRFLPVAAEGQVAIQALDLTSCRLSFPITF